MLSTLDPKDLMDNWQAHTILQYCNDIDMQISEADAYDVVQKFSCCPIKEFQNAGTTEPAIICILIHECEPLFQKGQMKKSDFLPISIVFERQDPFELPITPDIYGENEYCELFNEVLAQFLP